jgi:hypothetical protein
MINAVWLLEQSPSCAGRAPGALGALADLAKTTPDVSQFLLIGPLWSNSLARGLRGCGVPLNSFSESSLTFDRAW